MWGKSRSGRNAKLTKKMRKWQGLQGLPLVYQSCFFRLPVEQGKLRQCDVLPGLAGTFAFFQHHLCHLIMSPASSQVVARGRTV